LKNKIFYVKLALVILGSAVLLVCANISRLHIAKIAEEQGNNAYEQDNYSLAISAYTRANNLIFWDKERKASILNNRGLAYWHENDDFDMAIADINKAIKLYPKDRYYYFFRGLIYEDIHNYKLAIADYSKEIELFDMYEYLEQQDLDDILITYLSRANMYRLNKDYVLAIADYDYVIQSTNKNINSANISNEEIAKNNKRRDEAITQKKNIEKLLEWKNSIIGTSFVNVYPDEPDTYEYEFLSVDIKNTTELIMLLGYALNEYPKNHPLLINRSLAPTEIYENNTELSQNIIDEMKKVGANVSLSTAFKDFLVVNLLLPDGSYTTVIFE